MGQNVDCRSRQRPRGQCLNAQSLKYIGGLNTSNGAQEVGGVLGSWAVWKVLISPNEQRATPPRTGGHVTNQLTGDSTRVNNTYLTPKKAVEGDPLRAEPPTPALVTEPHTAG